MHRNKQFLYPLFLFFAFFTDLFSQETRQDSIIIRSIIINGNHAFVRKDILDVLGIPEKKTIFFYQIKKSIENVENFYKQKGYTLCEVEAYIDLNGNLIVNIYEGIIEEVFFLKLNYIEVILFRQEFGDYRNKVFYQPVMDEKLKTISDTIFLPQYEFFIEYELHKEKKGYYYLFISKRKKSPEKILEEKKLTGEEQQKPKPYVHFYFNFRGWALSLVPYVNLTFYNLGGIDHSLRLGVDIRFSTLDWFYLKSGIVNEYYTANYFSPPIYKDFRFNFYTGALINRTGRSDIKASYKTIRFPFELGFGLDFKYFFGSIRLGTIYEKIRNVQLVKDDPDPERNSPVSESLFPELLKNTDNVYQKVVFNFSHAWTKKYMREKDDWISVDIGYQFNIDFYWLEMNLNWEKYLLYGNHIFVARQKFLWVSGKYPAHYLPGMSSDTHLRGYKSTLTDLGTAFSFEVWASLYKDYLHLITLTDIGYFNNLTYNYKKEDPIAMGNFGFSYGTGLSFSYYEMNLRFYYALPIKQRADKGWINFYFRRRF